MVTDLMHKFQKICLRGPYQLGHDEEIFLRTINKQILQSSGLDGQGFLMTLFRCTTFERIGPTFEHKKSYV